MNCWLAAIQRVRRPFYAAFNSTFEFRTVVCGRGTMKIYGVSIIRSVDYSSYIDADENLQVVRTFSLSSVCGLQCGSPLTSIETFSFVSLNSSNRWLAIAAFLFSALMPLTCNKKYLTLQWPLWASRHTTHVCINNWLQLFAFLPWTSWLFVNVSSFIFSCCTNHRLWSIIILDRSSCWALCWRVFLLYSQQDEYKLRCTVKPVDAAEVFATGEANYKTKLLYQRFLSYLALAGV